MSKSPPAFVQRWLTLVTAALLIATALVVAPGGRAQAAVTLLSQGKTATSSSTENGGTPAAAAVDGNTGTRWSSAFADPQWLQVDLGSTAAVSRVVLNWETAYGKSFQLQVSESATGPWTSIYTTTAGTGGTQTLDVTGSGRYVRMLGTARATGYGYSLWEFQVFGTTDGGSGPVIPPTDPMNPDFGPNVSVFTPATPQAQMQAKLDQVAAQQHTNQFGTERYALLFKPGTYTADVNLGFNTQVAGLGLNPDDVNINGHVRVEADWLQQGSDPNNKQNATQNFWRSAENMAVTPPNGQIERWAVAQAAPYRRMHLKGAPEIQLWSGGDGWASGGLFADTKIDNTVVSGSQQQWLSRNSEFGGWAGSVWNMVFVGTTGAPPQHFPDPAHTVVGTTPVIREKPFLYVDNAGSYNVFVPALRQNSAGTSWSHGPAAGTSISLSQFLVAKPDTPVATINAALDEGKHLLFTPGVYHLNDTIKVTKPNTVVLGLGLATLTPDTGKTAISVADVDGVKLGGLLIDAGPVNTPVLVEVGQPGSNANHAANPTTLHDVFVRIGGGSHLGKATVSVQVNSNNVIGDHLWLWRADHGDQVGWDVNTAANGLVVNGNDVTMYGLFVEHYQQFETLWNGNGGKTYFFQNEFPYDVPNQAAWTSGGGTQGWAAYKVASNVTSHEAWGVGSYSFFQTNPSIVASHSFEVPDTPGVRFHDLVSVSLGGVGTIANVINNTGGTANAATQQRYLVSYP